MNPLAYRGVTKSYGDFHLGPIDLEIPEGYVTGLVGANGAGKTTLIKIALGLVRPDGGEVAAPDHDEIGVVYDVPTLAPHWRAGEAGRLLAPFYRRWDPATFDRMLAWAGVDPDVKVSALSRGMGMKLQLALALAHDARLLLLDEPTAGLDPLARSELLDMIAEFMTDPTHTVLFSTHITTDLDRVADHLAVMAAGRLVESGPRDEVLESYRMVRGGGRPRDDVAPWVRGLRQHSAGWQGLMRTEDTASLDPGLVVEAPTVEELVVHLAKDRPQEMNHD